MNLMALSLCAFVFPLPLFSALAGPTHEKAKGRAPRAAISAGRRWGEMPYIYMYRASRFEFGGWRHARARPRTCTRTAMGGRVNGRWSGARAGCQHAPGSCTTLHTANTHRKMKQWGTSMYAWRAGQGRAGTYTVYKYRGARCRRGAGESIAKILKYIADAVEREAGSTLGGGKQTETGVSDVGRAGTGSGMSHMGASRDGRRRARKRRAEQDAPAWAEQNGTRNGGRSRGEDESI
ncbi:hypothetical protein DFH11DRAFT_1540877 [Phellopilus nigrolimitatus]|nr:hypothetical protein DFH11DRAFT_1540877 [Phellopilus nigrolimitatus]